MSPVKKAVHIGNYSHKIKFDWQDYQETWKQVLLEVHELKKALKLLKTSANKKTSQKKQARSEVSHELGDVFFTLAQLARHLGMDADKAFTEANQRIWGRIQHMEKLCKKDKQVFKKLSDRNKEKLWKKVKKAEKTKV
ncbi:MAG: hypothetical protein ACOYOK_13785 [Pseudobdellovibrionaceae bacterium]